MKSSPKERRKGGEKERGKGEREREREREEEERKGDLEEAKIST